jgi:hypothetical protein
MPVCLTETLESSTPYLLHITAYARAFVCGCPQGVSNSSCRSRQQQRTCSTGSTDRLNFLHESITRRCYDAQRSYHASCSINYLSELVTCRWRRPKLVAYSAHFQRTERLHWRGISGHRGNLEELDWEVTIIDPCVVPGGIILWSKYKGDMDTK